MKEKLKVLFVTSEARSFAASGGLGDISDSLPKALNQEGIDCRIVMPLYDVIKEELRKKMKLIATFTVSVGWRHKECRVFELENKGVVYYFLCNAEYFERGHENIGKYYDDSQCGEMYAFFSRAAAEMPKHIGVKFDVVNANDWQTALVPLYLSTFYSQEKVKCVFTIHNIAFQGKFSFEIFDVLGLPPQEVGGILEYEGGVNLMKGAIECSHAVVVVSPKYREEVMGNHSDLFDFGCGLTPIMKKNHWKLHGILNGADMDEINPLADPLIYKNYDSKTFVDGKKQNKAQLQKDLGLEQNVDLPMIGIVTRIDSMQKGCELVLEVLQKGLLESQERHNLQFVILGTAASGDNDGLQMESVFRGWENHYRGRVCSYIAYDKAVAQRIYAAADMFLMPSKFEPCGLGQIYALRYGTVPLVREVGGLYNTVKDSENGFTFQHYSSDEIIHVVNRALEKWRDIKNWRSLVRHSMKCDFGWNKKNGSAQEYINLYTSLL